MSTRQRRGWVGSRTHNVSRWTIRVAPDRATSNGYRRNCPDEASDAGRSKVVSCLSAFRRSTDAMALVSRRSEVKVQASSVRPLLPPLGESAVSQRA